MSEQLASIEKVVFLESVMLFSHCTADELLRIAAIAGERRFGPGETLYKVNDPPAALYCVVNGEVTVEAPDGTARQFGPCGAVGVLEILSGRLRAATARATAPALTLAIDAEDFFDLLSNNVEIVKSLFRILLHERGPEWL